MRHLSTGFLILFGVQAGSSGLGRELTPGLQLIYASNDQEQPAWVIDSVTAGMALLPQGDCARFYLRRQPTQAQADENRVCVVRDTLFMWDARRGSWQPRRPVGAGMTLYFPQANGDTVRYTTGTPSEEVISGRRLVVIPTTVLTTDSLGRPKRRLRERFALGLVTATGGVFERPDSGSVAGWRVEQAFELRAIRSGAGPSPPDGQGRPARAHAVLDHLILGINSLENGMKAFAALTGIVPIRGGVHPGAGTENALVSLGDGGYLELIAPRPGATPTSFAIISSLDRLTPIGWALHTDSLSALVEQLRKTDSVLGPFPGSRQTPDGRLLTWKTAHMATPGLEAAPFLIEWGPSSVHPSSTSPSGCRLTQLIVTEPAPDRLTRFFKVVGLGLVVQAEPKRRLGFTLQCPRGAITFSN